jgi:hypothetical protein
MSGEWADKRGPSVNVLAFDPYRSTAAQAASLSDAQLSTLKHPAFMDRGVLLVPYRGV